MEIDEMKSCVRENKGMREYLEDLADAYRNGYCQTEKNNFMRLETWRATYNRADEAVIIKRQSWREQVEVFK